MSRPKNEVRLAIGAWYGDLECPLTFPNEWLVDVFWPSTPAPIGDMEIHSAIDAPVGQAPLRELAAGKRRPLIILDDLTRPTPADLVVPHLLRHLDDAGIPRSEVRIMLGNGAHGVPPVEAVVRKAGPAAAGCRAVVHDAWRRGVRVGTTSFGSPVIVDPEVAASDLLIGVGGVYPQHSVGFGGGSKLVLGVLGRRSIVSLHYSHPSVAGSYDVDNDFRRDLDEMARIAGLRTIVTLHVDALRRPVRIVCGDPATTYENSVAFSRTAFAAPTAVGHDVVVSNAYPMDVSLTFSRSKGLAPLAFAAETASKVLIAACPEGLGLHRLFPYLNGPRLEPQVHQLRRLASIRPTTVPARLVHKGRAAMRRLARTTSVADVAQVHRSERPQAFAGELRPNQRRPVHLWTPLAPAGSLPDVIADFERHTSWEAVIDAVQVEQRVRSLVRVAVYPCAPLLRLEHSAVVRVAV